MKLRWLVLAAALLVLAGGRGGAFGNEQITGSASQYLIRSYPVGQPASGSLNQAYTLNFVDDLTEEIEIGGTFNYIKDIAMHSDARPSSWRLSPYLNAREQAPGYNWQLGVQQNQSTGSNSPNLVMREYYSRLNFALPESLPSLSLNGRFVQNYGLNQPLSELGEWEMRTAYSFRAITLRYELNRRTYSNLPGASTTKTLNSTLAADYNYNLGLRLLPETQVGLGYDHSSYRTANEDALTGVDDVTNRGLDNFYGTLTSRPLPGLSLGNSSKYQLGSTRTAAGKTTERNFENSLSLAGEVLESCHLAAGFNHRDLGIGSSGENIRNTYNAGVTMQPLPAINYSFDVSREDRFEAPEERRVYHGRGFNNTLALELYRNIVQGTLQYAVSHTDDVNQNLFGRSRYFRPALRYRLSEETYFDLSNQYNWSRAGLGAPEYLSRDHALTATTDFARLPLRLIGTLRFQDDQNRDEYTETLQARWNWSNLLVITGTVNNSLVRAAGEKKKATAMWSPSSMTSRSS